MNKILQLSSNTFKVMVGHALYYFFQYQPCEVRGPVNMQNIQMAIEDLSSMCKAKISHPKVHDSSLQFS